MDPDALIDAANAWMADDPDSATRAATQAILDRGDPAELASHFGQRLQFGTAGLRGELGPGPGRMNRAIVRRVSAGLADYVLREVPGAAERGIVIGFDGRHGSREFADDTAAVFAGKGLVAHLFSDTVATPELGHAVTELGAAAGVMVTASHNPPKDNGYKVYWTNGAQIIPPHDAGISACIDAIGGLSDVAVPDLDEVRAQGLIKRVPDAIGHRYFAKVGALRVHGDNGLRIVYTAMHGVGARPVERALKAAGHTELHFVEQQRWPDGDFPTVAFPNPEEPGALDLSMALAAQVDADIIVANDPDADRLSVAVPLPGGGWRQLSGNQVGCLLAEDLLTHGEQWKGAERLVATTIVSSQMLSAIAAAHGAQYAECLTGFKWIANAAIPFDAGGGHFVMGYEEALGYSIGPVVRDKDGVSATLAFCDLAAWHKANGRSVLDALEALYARYGVYASLQYSLKLPGAAGKARIEQILAALRAAPPAAVGGSEVVRIQDVWTGVDRDVRGGTTSDVALPKSNVLAFHLADGSRVLARPSGTEPKVKFYFEVKVPLQGGLDASEARAAERIAELKADFLSQAGVS